MSFSSLMLLNLHVATAFIKTSEIFYGVQVKVIAMTTLESYRTFSETMPWVTLTYACNFVQISPVLSFQAVL